MQKIDEEIQKLVTKYGGKNEIVGGNLDYDLHFFSVFVVQQYREAMKMESYTPDEVKFG